MKLPINQAQIFAASQVQLQRTNTALLAANAKNILVISKPKNDKDD